MDGITGRSNNGSDSQIQEWNDNTGTHMSGKGDNVRELQRMLCHMPKCSHTETVGGRENTVLLHHGEKVLSSSRQRELMAIQAFIVVFAELQS